MIMKTRKDVWMRQFKFVRITRAELRHRIRPAGTEVPPAGIVPVGIWAANVVFVDPPVAVVVVTLRTDTAEALNFFIHIGYLNKLAFIRR